MLLLYIYIGNGKPPKIVPTIFFCIAKKREQNEQQDDKETKKATHQRMHYNKH